MRSPATIFIKLRERLTHSALGKIPPRWVGGGMHFAYPGSVKKRLTTRADRFHALCSLWRERVFPTGALPEVRSSCFSASISQI